MTEALDPVEDNPEFKNGVGAEQKPAVPCESGLKWFLTCIYSTLLRPTPAFLLWTLRCLNGCAIFIQIEGRWNSPVFGKSTFRTRPKRFRLLLTAVTHTLPIYGRTYSQLHSSLSCKKVFFKVFFNKWNILISGVKRILISPWIALFYLDLWMNLYRILDAI